MTAAMRPSQQAIPVPPRPRAHQLVVGLGRPHHDLRQHMYMRFIALARRCRGSWRLHGIAEDQQATAVAALPPAWAEGQDVDSNRVAS